MMNTQPLKSRHISWIWIAVLVLALATRLGGLHLWPLAPEEAMTAMASWDAAHGHGWPQRVDSPFVMLGNALLFLIFGGGDGIARLLPALAGAALVLLPWAWRERLGETGALAAAGLMLGSPLLLFASRQVHGTVVGLTGAAMVLTALVLAEDQDQPHLSRLAASLMAAGLALGLTGGAAFYTLLIPAALARWLHARLTGECRVCPLRPWMWSVIIGLGLAELISIGWGMRLSGWSGIAEGVAAWLRQWQVQDPRPTKLAMLGVYELATLFLAAVGIGMARKQQARGPWFFALWAGLTLLLTFLMPGLPALGMGAAVIPLALLGGDGVQRLTQDIAPDIRRWVMAHMGLGFIFWLPVGLGLAGYVNQAAAWPWLMLLLGLVVLVALQILLGFLFVFAIPQARVWRGAILGLALALGMAQLGAAWGVAYVRPTSPAEPAIQVATAPDVWALRRTLDELAVQRRQRRDTLPVTVVVGRDDLTAVLRWTLRDFSRLSMETTWPGDAQGLIITPKDFTPKSPPAFQWHGMSFVALTRAETDIPLCRAIFPPDCVDFLRWYLYRQLPTDQPQQDKVILWTNGN